MSRQSKDTDFTVPVEGIGTFTFGRRKMVDEFAIQREYADIISGVTPTAVLDCLATWFSTFRVMTVRAPAGWDLEEMDPLDESTYDRLKQVYDALSEKELSFRRKPGALGEGSGAPAV